MDMVRESFSKGSTAECQLSRTVHLLRRPAWLSTTTTPYPLLSKEGNLSGRSAPQQGGESAC